MILSSNLDIYDLHRVRFKFDTTNGWLSVTPFGVYFINYDTLTVQKVSTRMPAVSMNTQDGYKWSSPPVSVPMPSTNPPYIAAPVLAGMGLYSQGSFKTGFAVQFDASYIPEAFSSSPQSSRSGRASGEWIFIITDESRWDESDSIDGYTLYKFRNLSDVNIPLGIGTLALNERNDYIAGGVPPPMKIQGPEVDMIVTVCWRDYSTSSTVIVTPTKWSSTDEAFSFLGSVHPGSINDIYKDLNGTTGNAATLGCNAIGYTSNWYDAYIRIKGNDNISKPSSKARAWIVNN